MRRSLLLGLAALTCPCHLPLLAALLAGTAQGGFLADNLPLALVAFGSLFGLSLWLWARQPAEAASAATPALAIPPALSVEADPAEPLRVELLKTPGCASCAGVERSWEALRPEYGERVQVEVIDLLERPEVAQRSGVLRSPAVVVDGRLRVQGALDAARLRRLLDEALRERVGALAASREGGGA